MFLARTMDPPSQPKHRDIQERTKNRLVLLDLEAIGRLSSVITVPEESYLYAVSFKLSIPDDAMPGPSSVKNHCICIASNSLPRCRLRAYMEK